MKNKLNAFTFIDRKKANEKISMITCYDYSFAKIVNDSNIDCILVGDSASMVMHGYPTTINASIEMMEWHTKAVSVGAPNKFIIGDLPFLSYRKSLSENMNNIELLMKAGAEALKLEGALGNLELIKYLVESGVPVMGHLGLTPQSVHTLGGFKVQGREAESHRLIHEHSKMLEDVGCFSLVLECVPSLLAREITTSLHIPTIGIGAGVDTDGQVLVLQDLLGFSDDFKPKFLRRFLNGKGLILEAFNNFNSSVKDLSFPNDSEKY